MAAQILSDPTAQQSVMNSLFAAFAGFTAFGAAIVAVLASHGAVQQIADRLTSCAEREHPRSSSPLPRTTRQISAASDAIMMGSSRRHQPPGP